VTSWGFDFCVYGVLCARGRARRVYTVVLFFARYLCSLQQLLRHTQDTRPGVCPLVELAGHRSSTTATRATQRSTARARPPPAPRPQPTSELRAWACAAAPTHHYPAPRTPTHAPSPRLRRARHSAQAQRQRAPHLHYFVRAEAQIAAQYTHTTVHTRDTTHARSHHHTRVSTQQSSLRARAACRCALGLAAAPRAAKRVLYILWTCGELPKTRERELKIRYIIL
jgi:hypothetical protein